MLERIIFKEFLLTHCVEQPTMDEYDYMAKNATANTPIGVAKNVLLTSIPIALAGLTLGGLGYGINKLIDQKRERKKEHEIENAVDKIIESYPELQNIDRDKIKRAVRTYSNVYPDITESPEIAGQILASYGPDAGINLQVLKEMAGIHQAVARGNSDNDNVSQYIKSVYPFSINSYKDVNLDI